ncbi:hypothetical protein [Rhodococcus jostii]|uniref:hypothetical protein n=1 Tax=Rhodococcus jostii TaxID=132919 RepID=UPI00362CF939
MHGAGQRRQRVLGCARGLLGVGEGGELDLPAGLPAADHQPVLRLDRVEGAFGPVRS